MKELTLHLLPSIALAAFLSTGISYCSDEKAVSSGPVFSVNWTGGDPAPYETKSFSALLGNGKSIEGKAASDKAVSRAATDRWKDKNGWPNGNRLFPTGAEGMAAIFQIGGAFGLGEFTIAMELRGRGWKADSGKEETLVSIEGDGGMLSLLSDGKGNLVLRSASGSLSSKAPESLDKIHSLIATLDKGQATIYWDGLPLVSGPLSGLGKVKSMTLGQAGPGPGDNKDIIKVEIYDHPLKQAQVSQWHLDIGVQPAAHITVVESKKPIKIDGVLEPEEWADAARITGLVKAGVDHQYGVVGPASLASDQSEFYVSYDKEYLYIAHHSPPPAKIAGQTQLVVAMLKRSMDKHDDALVFDDNVKITTLDNYPDVGEEKRIYMNGKDTTYEFLPLKWDPKMLVKSRLTDTGWWVEEAIPWKDLNMGAPEPGKTVHINLQRGWKQELDENHLWTWGRYDAATGRLLTESSMPNSAGAVTLAGASGVVVRLDEVGPLNQGKVDIKGVVANLTGTEKKIMVELTSNTGAISKSLDISVPPGARDKFQFDGTITDFKTSLLTLRIIDVADGKEYFAQGWPVRRRYEPEIYVRKYRSRELIAFENNFEFLSETPLEDIGARLTITGRESGKVMFDQRIPMKSYVTRDEVSTKDWPIGKYDVSYKFKSGWFTRLGEARTVYDRVPLPPWWDSDVGNEDFKLDVVPYPWSNMSAGGNTVRCWGRSYDFGDMLMPQQITTLGRPLLRSPMSLKAVAADGSVLDSAAAKCAKTEWTKTAKTHVEGLREIENDSFALRNEFRIEYDGFAWVKLTVVPKNSKKIVLKELVLDIPITPEFTDVMNAYEYGLNNCGSIRDYTGTTVPLWIGNGVGGIQWLNECDGPLFVKDLKEVAHIILGTGEGATLREEMINITTEFEQPHTFEFGFIATPTRPKIQRTIKDPDFWGLRGDIGGYWYPKGQEFLPAPDYGFRGGWIPCPSNATSGNPCYSGLTRCYVTTGTTNVDADVDGRDFGDEWLASPSTRLQGCVTCTQASKKYVNYFVWRHWNAMQSQYPYQNFYYDGPAESGSSNEFAGAGYVTRDGRRVSSKGILGARELCRRMYNILIRWYPFGSIFFHSSGMMNMAYYPFCTAIVDGENFNTILGSSQPTYVNSLTPERFRGEYMGFNLCGNQSVYVAQGRMGLDQVKIMGSPENVMDHLQGLFLLHDNSPPGWVFGNNDTGILDQSGKRCWDAVQKHCLFSPFYEFLPYWEQKAVKPPFPEFYATFYVFRNGAPIGFAAKAANEFPVGWDPYNFNSVNFPLQSFSIFGGMTSAQKAAYRKAVCIFYNHSDFKGEMRLKLDWKAIGFEGPQGVTAENAVHSIGFAVETVKDEKGVEIKKALFPPKPEESARIEGDEVIFPMTPWNYRMIVLEKK